MKIGFKTLLIVESLLFGAVIPLVVLPPPQNYVGWLITWVSGIAIYVFQKKRPEKRVHNAEATQ